ncbi:MAG TPA: glycosyltransferase family 4 protein [Terriglobales bacterium]|nr:glycosyltransferase family 4 protein [Terriglobales bacterium]
MSVSAEPVHGAPNSLRQTLRILHLHSGNMMGGIESALLTFAEFASGCPELQQSIALAFKGIFADSIGCAGMKVHELPSVHLRNPVSVIRSRHALARLLDQFPFDVIISHSAWCQTVYGPVLKRSRIPVVFWQHSTLDGHWLQRLASRHIPDFVICNSAHARATLANVYPDVPSSVLFHPVKKVTPSGDPMQLRIELRTSRDDVVILMASRMERWKGHLNLIHAAAKLSAASPWTIWVAGGPQTDAERKYFELLENEVARLKLTDRFRFLGQRRDVQLLMHAADIFCQPNEAPEPFGIVFVEALQAGLPVVTFAMGGPCEILDGNCGVLVPPEDIDSLARSLSALIDSPELRARFRSAGPERAKSLCDPAHQVQSLYNLLFSLVQKRGPAA